jgi:hypothetical protein
MKLSKAQRKQVFDMFGGRCAYCGCDLPEKGWHADHVEPICREWWKKGPLVRHDLVDGKIVRTEEKRSATCLYPERDVLENHFPACRACNIDKNACPLEMWRRSLEQRVEVCRRNHAAFRHAERFGRVAIMSEPLVFWFERFNVMARGEVSRG